MAAVWLFQKPHPAIVPAGRVQVELSDDRGPSLFRASAGRLLGALGDAKSCFLQFVGVSYGYASDDDDPPDADDVGLGWPRRGAAAAGRRHRDQGGAGAGGGGESAPSERLAAFEKGFRREGPALVCDNGSQADAKRGVTQSVVLNQTRPEPIVAVAWSKAEGSLARPIPVTRSTLICSMTTARRSGAKRPTSPSARTAGNGGKC